MDWPCVAKNKQSEAGCFLVCCWILFYVQYTWCTFTHIHSFFQVHNIIRTFHEYCNKVWSKLLTSSEHRNRNKPFYIYKGLIQWQKTDPASPPWPMYMHESHQILYSSETYTCLVLLYQSNFCKLLVCILFITFMY
jgi:hypothetical protein